ncbi:DUF4215 domain-containing protein, partial [Thermodesulfobacteriota bacterium]
MKKTTITLSFVFVLVAAAMWVPQVEAYNNFSGGCNNCHGKFREGIYTSRTSQDPVSWGTNLHSGHQGFAGCTACHQQIGDNPLLGGPSGDSFDSCMGCHGRDEDVNSGQIGAGLRQHHTVTGAASCGGCHSDNNPANFTPVGEDIPGARNADLGIDPCDDAVFGAYGSDNDGDNVYDGNDPDCAQPPVCGNGTVESGEQCDDGNTVNGDTCQADCQLPVCGDGIVDPDEQCDDGNIVDGDDCQADCQLPVCGDGILDAGENCDDSNTASNDGCSSTCQDEFCGDGIQQTNEACDDGNTANGDDCENDCTVTPPAPFCGDGNVDAGESCDDGNTANGDG